MTKAYLVQLDGMDDHRWYLLNEEHWKIFDDARNGRPVNPPDSMIDTMVDDCGVDRDEVLRYFDPTGVDAHEFAEGLACCMPASEFNGEQYDDWDGSVRQLNAFVKKHKLDLVETFEGTFPY